MKTERPRVWIQKAKESSYLSESLTKIAFKKPDKVKLEVISGRESGSNGYGLISPHLSIFIATT